MTAIMRTSLVALTTKRRGYTLIEMTVIIVLIAIFAAMVGPYLVALRDGQQRRATLAGVADLAVLAREMAVSNSQTMYLEPDTTSNALVLKEQYAPSSYQATANGASASAMSQNADTMVVNGKVQSTRTTSNIGTESPDASQDKTIKKLTMTSGLQFGNYQLAGTTSDPSSWKLHFYADGTSDGGAVEVLDKGKTQTLVVNVHSGIKMIDGTLPDTTNEKWQAGNYVQRTY